MATKQAISVHRAFLRGRKQGKVREEKHVLGLLIAIILFLLYLLFAQHNGWWPYSSPDLGTAFYTNVSAQAPTPAGASASTSSSGSNGSSGSTGSTGSGSGSSNSGGSGGSSTPPSSGSNPIATFAAGVNVGNTMAQTSTEANGLGQNCAVVANASASAGGGQQEVCVYTQGDKLVTVTFLNGRVISASKSGF